MRTLIGLLLLGTTCTAVVHADEIDTLSSIVADSKDLADQSEAIDKLKHLGRPALPALRELLDHPEPTIRVLVLSALGNLSSPRRESSLHAA